MLGDVITCGNYDCYFPITAWRWWAVACCLSSSSIAGPRGRYQPAQRAELLVLSSAPEAPHQVVQREQKQRRRLFAARAPGVPSAEARNLLWRSPGQPDIMSSEEKTKQRECCFFLHFGFGCDFVLNTIAQPQYACTVTQIDSHQMCFCSLCVVAL